MIHRKSNIIAMSEETCNIIAIKEEKNTIKKFAVTQPAIIVDGNAIMSAIFQSKLNHICNHTAIIQSTAYHESLGAIRCNYSAILSGFRLR